MERGCGREWLGAELRIDGAGFLVAACLRSLSAWYKCLPPWLCPGRHVLAFLVSVPAVATRLIFYSVAIENSMSPETHKAAAALLRRPNPSSQSESVRPKQPSAPLGKTTQYPGSAEDADLVRRAKWAATEKKARKAPWFLVGTPREEVATLTLLYGLSIIFRWSSVQTF